MEKALAKPQHSTAVRGNLFSYLLPWDGVMKKLSKAWADGDFTEWPLDQSTCCEIVRIVFVKGQEALIDQVKSLSVRSRVVKEMAKIYIESHYDEVCKKMSARKYMNQTASSLHEHLIDHINKRVDEHYPSSVHDTLSEAVPQKLREAASQTEESEAKNKQAAGRDAPQAHSDPFTNVRPLITTAARDAKHTHSPQTQVQEVFRKVSGLQVKMATEFEDQWVPEYMSRIFPWALKYSCGGAKYPDLFADWENSEREQSGDRADLTPGHYAQMLATRPEMQIAADWLLVPSARNLHWRYQVLHNAFTVVQYKSSADTDHHAALVAMLDAMKRIWAQIAANKVTIGGEEKYINGDLRLLLRDDTCDATARAILNGWIRCTEHVAGCQALRRKMGHILFGFRTVHGECIFVTISPNKRHTALLLRLSRVRRNDTGLLAKDSVTRWRALLAGHDCPEFEYGDVEIPLPTLEERQAICGQDPLAVDHHFLVIVKVVVPRVFGYRMCLAYPHCTCHSGDPARSSECKMGCSDLRGSNAKLMGGYAGLASGACFSVEYQKEASPHVHGLVALTNIFSHQSLHAITKHLQKVAMDERLALIQRIKSFVNHLERSSDFNVEQHTKQSDLLEILCGCWGAKPSQNPPKIKQKSIKIKSWRVWGPELPTTKQSQNGEPDRSA